MRTKYLLYILGGVVFVSLGYALLSIESTEIQENLTKKDKKDIEIPLGKNKTEKPLNNPPNEIKKFNPISTKQENALQKNDLSEALNALVSPSDIIKNKELFGEYYDMIDKIIDNGWNNDYFLIEEILDKNRISLFKLKTALDKGNCEIQWLWSQELLRFIPAHDIVDYNQLGLLLVLETRYLQKQQDTTGVVRNLEDGIRLSQLCCKQGGLFNKLFGLALERNFITIIQSEFQKTTPDIDFLESVERSLYDLSYTKELASEIFLNERKLVIARFKKLLEFSDEELFLISKQFSLNLDRVSIEEGMKIYNRYTDELLSALKESFYTGLTKASEISDEFNGKKDILPDSLSGSTIPLWHDLLKRIAFASVTLDIAQTAVSIIVFQNKKGRIPHELSELVPYNLKSVPIDPFSNKPLKYIEEEKRWLLYSYGSDMKDDKAIIRAVNASEKGDIVFSSK
jgi:hypothetical protein